MADLMLEANYLSRLNHSNILKLRGAAPSAALWSGHYDGYFVLTDKVEETLDVAIHETWTTKETSKSVAARTLLALQIAQALKYLHSKRIIYRNLRPQNIGLLKVADNQDSIIQLFDFGAARELPPSIGLGGDNEVFHMTQAVGSTFRYRAVEVTSGPHYNCKADVYSWAMVVYEMLSGSEPFSGMKEKEFVQRVIHGRETPSTEEFTDFGGLMPVLDSAWNADLFLRPTMAEVCASVESIASKTKEDGYESASTIHSNSEQ